MAEEYATDVFESAEREFQQLYVLSLRRIAEIVENGGEDNAVRCLRMVWEAHNKFPEKGGGGMDEAMMQMMAQGGGMAAFAMTGDQAQNAMKFLSDTREAPQGMKNIKDMTDVTPKDNE